MSVKVVYGIGYSTRSGNVFVSEGALHSYGADASVMRVAPPIEDSSSTQWAKWGSNNLLPMEMADHIENCGILNAALNIKASLATSKGIQPFLLKAIDPDGKEQLEWLLDNEILDWLEENQTFETLLDWSYDQSAYGWRVGSVMLNKKRDKINRLFRKDVSETRLAKKNGEGFIPEIFMCSDWKKISILFNSQTMARLPVLKEGFEFEDLTDRKQSDSGEFAFVDRERRNSRAYYTYPKWYSALEWVKGARSIPVQKNAIYRNQVTLRQQVTIDTQYWRDYVDKAWDSLDVVKREELMNETYDAIDTVLTGAENAGKTLFSGTYTPANGTEAIPYITIKPLTDGFGDGKLLPDSSAANVEILMAVMTNPAFIGAGGVGGKAYGSQSGGSNIRESYLTALMLMEAERKRNIRPLNMVAKFNGWNDRHNVGKQRLVFRYQSSLLTTLDTGKSTKQESL